LKDHARMRASADLCKREFGQDHGKLPDGYLNLRIDLGRERVARLKAKLAERKALLATEQSELESWEESLPVLLARGRDDEGYAQESRTLQSLPRDDLQGFCRGGFAQRVQELMDNIVVTEKMRP
jgi:hypothetical protein